MAFSVGELISGGTWDVGPLIYDPSIPVNTAPSFVGSLSADAITTTGFNVSFTLNEDSNYYAIAVPQGSAAPTPAEVKAGVSYGAVTVLAARTGAANENEQTTVSFTGITGYQGQQVTVYVAAEDLLGELQTVDQYRQITATLQAVNQPPTVSANYSLQTVDQNELFTFDGSANFTDTDVLTYSLSGLPDASISASSGLISWTPVSVGSFSGTVTATDTAGQSVSAQLPVNVLLPDNTYWQRQITDYFIIKPGEIITQDPQANRFYWFDFGEALSNFTVSSVVIDPDGLLSGSGLVVTSYGANTVTATDADGTQYPVGKLIGIDLSGGTADTRYHLTVRFVLSSGETDDRTVTIDIKQL